MSNIHDWIQLRGKLARDLEDYLGSPESAAGGMRRYALADAGQIPELRGSKFERIKIPYISLFTLTKEHAIARYGPLLIPIAHDASASTSIVAILLQGMRYGWTVSWLSSPLPLQELAEHLAGHLNGVLNDTRKVLVRYYDPRVFPAFLETLDGPVKQALLAPIGQWTFWDRKLRLMRVDGGRQETSSGLNETVVSPEVQAALGDAAQIDWFMGMLLEQSDADEFADWLPHALYVAVARQVEQGRVFGLTEAADLQLFVSLSMCIHPGFHQLLDVFVNRQESIKTGRAGITDLVLAVSDAEWSHIGNTGAQVLHDMRMSINQELWSVT